jgi:MFS family permease
VANETNDLSGESTADLLKRLSEQTSRLVSQEMQLAKAELTEKGKKAGIGAGMFGGAGVIGFYAFGALVATVIALLSKGMDTWLAALIVTVVLGAIAGVLALVARNKVQEAAPPLPERAVESVRTDVQVTKDSVQRGRA